MPSFYKKTGGIDMLSDFDKATHWVWWKLELDSSGLISLALQSFKPFPLDLAWCLWSHRSSHCFVTSLPAASSP